jgi:ankyrin repeat protein
MRAADALKAIGGPPTARATSAVAPPAADRADPAREQRGLEALRALGVKFDERSFSKAITGVQPGAVEAFLDAGMSADHRFSRLGFNTLHTLLESGSGCDAGVRPTPEPTKAVLRLLIARGADVNAQHEGGRNTPLMFAMNACDGEIVKALFAAGADPKLRNASDMEAFSFSLLYKNKDAVDALLATGYRLPRNDYATLKKAYGDEPAALALIERAAPRR